MTSTMSTAKYSIRLACTCHEICLLCQAKLRLAMRHKKCSSEKRKHRNTECKCNPEPRIKFRTLCHCLPLGEIFFLLCDHHNIHKCKNLYMRGACRERCRLYALTLALPWTPGRTPGCWSCPGPPAVRPAAGPALDPQPYDRLDLCSTLDPRPYDRMDIVPVLDPRPYAQLTLALLWTPGRTTGWTLSLSWTPGHTPS